jgi:N-methylhydantoinase B
LEIVGWLKSVDANSSAEKSRHHPAARRQEIRLSCARARRGDGTTIALCRVEPGVDQVSLSSDPIELELFKNAIFSIADEMALTVFRTTYSGVLKDNMDYSTGFADADGKLAAQGLTLPGHLGSVPTAMDAIMRHFRDDMAPGDVFIMNDPFDGGMHLPDIFVFKPLYHEGERLAFACTVCHHIDVGGRVAGSNASDSTEIYAEGLRIAPMKLYEAGKLNKTIMTFLEKNVRLPVQLFGDLRAQLAACHIGESQFAEIVARYGAEKTRFYLKEVIDYAERLTRAALEKLPDGEWSFEDWIDDDGVDYGKPIRLFVTIRKKGGHMVVDWTGTNPQVKGAINNTLSFTKAASYTGVRSVLPPGIPNNEGVFRAIEVICPPGTVGNGVLPAACAARGLTGFRMVDCMFGALAMMLPDKVKAAGDGGNTGISIGGYDADRRPFVYVDFTCGAWGARPWADGLDGNSHMFANMASHSIEVTEAEQPMQLLAYEFVADRAGAGKFRGGVPFRRDYRFLEDEGMLQVRSDRRDHRPFGLYGGSPGAPSENYLNPDGENRLLPSKLTMTIRRGEVFRHVLAGAGGWGDPLERDTAAVLRDVRNELLSPAKALSDYGVVVDTANWTVDGEATARRRDEIRRARGWTETPKVQWQDPQPLRRAAE